MPADRFALTKPTFPLFKISFGSRYANLTAADRLQPLKEPCRRRTDRGPAHSGIINKVSQLDCLNVPQYTSKLPRASLQAFTTTTANMDDSSISKLQYPLLVIMLDIPLIQLLFCPSHIHTLARSCWLSRPHLRLQDSPACEDAGKMSCPRVLVLVLRPALPRPRHSRLTSGMTLLPHCHARGLHVHADNHKPDWHHENGTPGLSSRPLLFATDGRVVRGLSPAAVRVWYAGVRAFAPSSKSTMVHQRTAFIGSASLR